MVIENEVANAIVESLPHGIDVRWSPADMGSLQDVCTGHVGAMIGRARDNFRELIMLSSMSP